MVGSVTAGYLVVVGTAKNDFIATVPVGNFPSAGRHDTNGRYAHDTLAAFSTCEG